MTLTQTSDTPKHRRARYPRPRWFLAGSAILALATGIGFQAAGEQSAEAAPSATQNLYATINTAQGPLAGDAGNNFTVASYQWTVATTQTGRGVTIGDLTFTHPVGVGSISLTKAMVNNQALTSVKLIIPRDTRLGTGSATPIYTYAMTDCRVLELNNTGSAGTGTEQVKLHCTRALLSVPPGTPGGPASGLEVDVVTTLP